MSAELQPVGPLSNARWELLSRKVGTGTPGPEAYGDLFGCSLSNRSGQYRRLTKIHPEILLRAEEIRLEVHSQTIRRASLSRPDIQEALFDNIESAKAVGKAVVVKGEIVAYTPDHAAINASLKLLADINGLSLSQLKKKRRGEDDPEASLSPDQLLANIQRKYQVAKGKGMDDDAINGLRRIAALAEAGPRDGQPDEAEAETLPSISEAEIIP